MTNRQRILSAVSSEWEEFKRSIALVPQDDLDVPGVVGSWSVKDLIGHVATWDQEAVRALRRFLTDRDANVLTTWTDVDGFNAREADRKKDATLAEHYNELEESHRELVELLSRLAEVELGLSEVETRIRVDSYEHYADYKGEILRWLGTSDSTHAG